MSPFRGPLRHPFHCVAVAFSALVMTGCWPAAPIAALSSGGGDDHRVRPTILLHGHVITDPTVNAIVPPMRLPPYLVDPAAPPTLSISADAVDFGATGTNLVVQARNSGGGELTVTFPFILTPIIGVDPSWLTATLLADGKTIALVADRTLLAPGQHEVQVDVTSNGGAASFFVDVDVSGTIPTPIGPVIVDVLDRDGVTLIARVEATAADGYAWTMPRLPRGEYFLVAGVDLDSNLVIGDLDEPFGQYANIVNLELIEVDALDDLTIGLLVHP